MTCFGCSHRVSHKPKSSALSWWTTFCVVAFRMSVQKCSKCISNWRSWSLASKWLEIYFSLLYSVTKITHRPNKLEPVVLCQVCLALFDISLCLFCSTGVIANSMTFVKMTKLFPSYVSGSLYWINNNI